ncbi:MAG TPA: 2-C-methyl-D-erythritol 4-phosphate cytidylyltransferase [Pseudonocardiaceae bacterium]|jgi:2-C-methyl-D-erythritol 4-phosphate cytidylyltransferase|nr:2-C-methyl-D-erythritol 4-phosphate cytidylyltransferase [Pseudonocardiaceae bacterium]
MGVVALVPVAGPAGQFGPYSVPDIGVANADAGLSAAVEIPLLAPILNNLFAVDCIDLVALVVPHSQIAETTSALSDTADRANLADRTGKAVEVIGVDESTFDSTYSIITKALDLLPKTASVVLVHQLRHAYAPPELIRAVVDAVLAGAPAAVPVLPCTDTVKQLDEVGVIIDTPDRTTLRVNQAPLGFDIRHLNGPDAHLSSPARDTPGLNWFPSGARTVPGHPAARAIRTSFDLAFAQASQVGQETAAGETPAATSQVSSEV